MDHQWLFCWMVHGDEWMVIMVPHWIKLDHWDEVMECHMDHMETMMMNKQVGPKARYKQLINTSHVEWISIVHWL